MKPRTACFCFLCVLCCWTPGYPETYQPYTASAELQRAREQAEIEHWRAVEAKARSLRNTPDTEVHRKGRPSLQGEDLSLPKAPSRKKFSRGEMKKMAGAASQDRKPVLDSAESKKVRYRKTKLQAWRNTPESESQRKKRSYFPRENVALK
jgi:hypothetical protein